jgi:hypothetical protein
VREDNTRFVLFLLLCEVSDDAEHLNFIAKLLTIYVYKYIASKNLIFYSVVSYIWMFPVFEALFTVNNKNLSSVSDTLASSSHAKYGIMSEKNIILIWIELISLFLKNIQNSIK